MKEKPAKRCGAGENERSTVCSDVSEAGRKCQLLFYLGGTFDIASGGAGDTCGKKKEKAAGRENMYRPKPLNRNSHGWRERGCHRP